MKNYLKLSNIIIVLLFICWELNAQMAVPTFQAFSYVGTESALYSFSSHTFTNCGATGKNGPTLSNCTSAYSPSWTDNTNYFNVPSNAGIQYWTVPSSGTYTIEVWGGNGGDGHASNSTVPIGGRGARMKGDFTLTEEEILKILVGQMGTQTNSNTWNYGGGGGTFVAKSDNTALIVAGGGRGCCSSLTSGGGGGSYNNGSNQSNSSGVRTGHGQVIITRI